MDEEPEWKRYLRHCGFRESRNESLPELDRNKVWIRLHPEKPKTEIIDFRELENDGPSRYAYKYPFGEMRDRGNDILVEPDEDHELIARWTYRMMLKEKNMIKHVNIYDRIYKRLKEKYPNEDD